MTQWEILTCDKCTAKMEKKQKLDRDTTVYECPTCKQRVRLTIEEDYDIQ